MGFICEITGLPERYVINPYTEDIYGEEVWEWMCDECYHDACMDI